MEEQNLKKLEYHKIIERLANECSSILGKEKALALKPSLDFRTIEDWQNETSEAKTVLRIYPNFSLGGVRDIRGIMKKAEIGGIIEPSEFLLVLDTLGAAKKLKNFFAEEGSKYLHLKSLGEKLSLFPQLEEEIKRSIDSDGEVSDRASSELANLRRKMRTLQKKVKEKLDGYVRSPDTQKYLQENIITIRNERYVLPVKVEYRNQVPGLIHDQSASGATLFIEPMAVVELNNEAIRCEAAQKAEVIRILRHLTEKVEKESQALEETSKILGELDFIFAKGRLSSLLDCGQPKINQNGFLKIIQGRHPLIKEKAVPVTIHLGGDFDTLVITGPNTGGKTVTLKTVGLFTLMAQAGLHVPAEEGTELAVFSQIFADIGDEQSIEQSLSTFSSHMTNIIQILNKLTSNSLVLLDELGAGTDPTEGAALAMSILERLIERGSKTIATTHYSELKSFAYNRSRVENASVEFDIETLKPTYRLLIGIPGKSNAFEISLRLGLEKELVERAREFLSQEEVRVSDLIENLETNQLLSERDRQEAFELKKSAQRKIAELEERDRKLFEKAEEIVQKARMEALETVTRARRDSEAILKELRDAKKKTKEYSPQDLHQFRAKIKEQEAQLWEQVSVQAEDAQLGIDDLMPGDLVVIKRLNQKAQVLKKPNTEGEVVVQAGIMKLNVKLNELKKVEEQKVNINKERTGIGKIVSNKTKEIKHELDLRGYTVDEAIYEVEKYLDDVYLAGIDKVYLIHGKGTGALRSAIHELVKNHHFIESSRIGNYNEGGTGVTVVEFRKG